MDIGKILRKYCGGEVAGAGIPGNITTVLVSYDCYNKVLTRWLKTTEIDSVTVLRPLSQTSGY
jgi:hypothetical protein